MAEVIVVIGPGLIGQAIARRVGVGKRVLLADVREENAIAAAETLGNAGYDAIVTTVDVSSRGSVHALAEEAAALGEITGLIHAAGVSPSQASPETVLKVDLYGTALVLEEFGNVIAAGRFRCGDRIAVRAPAAGVARRAEPGAGQHARARTPRPAVPPARSGAGFVARLPARQAR